MFCDDNFCEAKIISKPKAEAINSSKMLVAYETSSFHSVLQPWLSLGLLYNQSPLLSIPHFLFPAFHLHLLQVTLNIV
jgi:hypothetical protein